MVTPPRMARMGLARVRPRRRPYHEVEGAGLGARPGPLRRARTPLPPGQPVPDGPDSRHAAARVGERGAADREPGSGSRSTSARQARWKVCDTDAGPRRPQRRARHARRNARPGGDERVGPTARAVAHCRHLAVARRDPDSEVRSTLATPYPRRGRGDRCEGRAVWDPRRHLGPAPRTQHRPLAGVPPKHTPRPRILPPTERPASNSIGDGEARLVDEPPSTAPSTASGDRWKRPGERPLPSGVDNGEGLYTAGADGIATEPHRCPCTYAHLVNEPSSAEPTTACSDCCKHPAGAAGIADEPICTNTASGDRCKRPAEQPTPDGVSDGEGLHTSGADGIATAPHSYRCTYAHLADDPSCTESTTACCSR